MASAEAYIGHDLLPASGIARCRKTLKGPSAMRKLIALLLLGSLMALGCGGSAPTASKGKNTEMPKSGGAPIPKNDKGG
jgi:hypothetical protein